MAWDFLQRYDESWIWRHVDRHQVTESTRNFAALDECVADAVRHGYVQTNAARRSVPQGSGHRTLRSKRPA